MTNQEIRELIQLVSETGIAELEVQRGENRVRIRRGSSSTDVSMPSAPAADLTPSPASGFPFPAQSAAATPSQTTLAVPAADASQITIKSPIVGTYYDAAAPSSPPFVKVGDVVQAGQVLCIIESMKLMNEIEAEVSGVITAKLVENGRPVEYGEALFTVRAR